MDGYQYQLVSMKVRVVYLISHDVLLQENKNLWAVKIRNTDQYVVFARLRY